MLNGIQDAVILYNPASGGRRHRRFERLEAARGILRGAGIASELAHTTGPGSATQLARRAVAQGRQMVIVCGGDGTINEAVNGLAGSQVPLAVLPAGTANVLAKELGLPWDIPRAARLIPAASLRRIALGAAYPASAPQTPRYFICVGGAGPDGLLVYSVKRGQIHRLGILAYWLEGLRQLFAYSFPAFRVTAAGHEHHASLAVVGRTKHYGGPIQITTQASLFEDSFEVMVSTARSRFHYLIDLPMALLGRHRSLQHNFFWKTTALRCEPLGGEQPRVRAQVDGEPIGPLPVEFRIVPDALTLVVPEGARL